MKACVIQPPYSLDLKKSDELFAYKLDLLKKCTPEMDLIVLPEYSDVPCATATAEDTLFYHQKYFDPLMAACKETAVRCDAVLFVNALDFVDGEYRNTTFAINRAGAVVGKYYKRHIPPLEKKIDVAYHYTEQYSEPYVLDLDGVRYAFLTCYDFYFYEAFPKIARKNVDVVIGCSLQRSDTHDALEIMCRHLAYNTNAYVVRASVSFAEDSDVCGASMIVSPRGKVLANLYGKFGLATADFDPKDKYYKPAGYGRAPAAHYEYIEIGRTPWNYRAGGSAVCLSEKDMPYPRLCAHRGFSAVLPENSLPAYGAAIALGAEEIEFDLWATRDGVLVSTHDWTLERTSNGEGYVFDHDYEELKKLDFGAHVDAGLAGLRIATFEDILKKFSSLAVMNIHVKIWDMEYEDDRMEEIVALLRKYDCADRAYFMTTSDKKIAKVKALAPDIAVCVGHDGNRPYEIVDRAIALGAEKVQLFKPYFNQEMIDKAHAHGIKCNVFYADDPEEAKAYRKMGIDTILTNNFLVVKTALETMDP
ncbi:MAG: hypothetical protein IJV96_03620 [Clostridia bacterium]|nr:hypothetical protein [Clostridia bacterium]